MEFAGVNSSMGASRKMDRRLSMLKGIRLSLVVNYKSSSPPVAAGKSSRSPQTLPVESVASGFADLLSGGCSLCSSRTCCI